MIVIDCIARVINQSVFCIKTIRGIVKMSAVIGRIFNKIYLFNRALGG